MSWKGYLLCLVLVGGMLCGAVGQQSAAERVHGIWEKRVAEFERENRALKRNVVLLGDSITEGFDVKKYFPGKPVLNRGIGSDVIGMPNDPLGPGVRGVMQRLKVSVFDCCTSHVFVMLGINDLGDGRTPEEIAAGYRTMLGAIRAGAPDATIHVESVLPTGGRYARHNENVRKLNGMLRELASEMGCGWVDVYALYVDEKGELRGDATREGLHLVPEAYGAWKREIDRVMGW